MIKSQLIILQQTSQYLSSVTQSQYSQVLSPAFMSSAGAHIRHILDHYYSVINGLPKRMIDYDKRSRGGIIERCPKAALQSIKEIRTFLMALTAEQLQQKIKLSTEISIKDKQVLIVDTTLAREIIFVGSHAVHHLATVKHIAQSQKITIDSALGVAPATATFLRGQP